MRTLIYGGSFNPPHLGHVTAVVAALEQREVDRVLVIPCGTPPHKELAEGSPDSPRRLELSRLAFGGLPGAEICDIEIRQDDVDYTVDTLQELERQYPEDEFALLVGTDMLLSIDTWRRHDYLLRGRTVYAMARDKGETDALREKAAQLERDWDCRVRILDKELVILSSTEVRAALKERQGQDMLPEEEGDITQRDAVDAALATEDLLSREKALDSLLWDRIEELTALEVLNLEVVLGFIARLKIVGRWVQLDPATGREFFRKLVETVRGSYKKQENN